MLLHAKTQRKNTKAAIIFSWLSEIFVALREIKSSIELPNPERSDARDDDSSTKAGPIKKLTIA